MQEFKLDELEQYASVHEFISVARGRHSIEATVDPKRSPDYYEIDGWGRLLKWESQETPEGQLIIRVISAGPNGSFGDGDDIYLQADVTRHKPLKLQIKKQR